MIFKNARILVVGLPVLLIGNGGATWAADPVLPTADWTGFHIGLGGGYGMVNHRLDAAIDDSDLSLEWSGIGGQGGLAGIEAGYDFQITDRYVLGLQADYTASSIATTVDAVSDSVPYSYSLEASDSVSILVRGGRIVDGSALLYNFAGYTRSTFYGDDNNGSSYDFDLDGLTFGGGIESAIAENVTLKLEYRYTMYLNMDDFNQESVDTSGLGIDDLDLTGSSLEDTSDVQTIRAVISYHSGAVSPWGGDFERSRHGQS
jgi:outer membrane immunogenic protein